MKKFIAISLLSLVSSVSMAATISLPDYLIFTAVDGKPVSNKSQLEISPGQHLIELQFYELFSSGADDTNFIKSDALYWSFNLSRDEDIKVYTKEILSSKNAKNFIKSPFITLESATIKGETVKLVNHEELMAIIMKQHSKMMQQ
ncbi:MULTISPECIES: DUF2057 family protein [Shewanella]|uniref:DUF2057 family protein n=1 Tax=Shewanella TaxID=22 RepID=UPI000F4FA199|nr:MULTISPECIES: DUF2057 family protein [Shewanella]MBB1322144.1 DUF2057 family protein [Shewanella sp. SR43-8]RPA56628.1 DUF2057 domain-containing protein [Shewanella vesiculosa]UJL43626.1 DUF2057 family protein [Shewanella vesiculosa]|tara:strand:- start:21809 stop:22243 length:435 start_codon:yes stop_codon:yes gene_type:complete